MSGTARVGAWLLKHGSTTIADWDRQPACDGGPKITRLAARIKDLRDEGWDIPPSVMVRLGGVRVARYTLLSKPSSPLTAGDREQRGERPDLFDSSVGCSPEGSPVPQQPLSVFPADQGLWEVAGRAPRHAIDDDWDWGEAA